MYDTAPLGANAPSPALARWRSGTSFTAKRARRDSVEPPMGGPRDWLDRALCGPRRAWGVAAALYVALTLVYLATFPAERLERHTPYNHFALMAGGWVEGRLDLGGPPPAYTGNNDFAVFDERVFVSFPPFPAVLIAPVVAIAESPEEVRDGRFFLWFAGLGPALLYLTLERLSRSAGADGKPRSWRSERDNVILALLFGLGTVFWFSAVQGTVWFAAHVVGVALLCGYLRASIDAEHPALAGALLALAFATRPSLAFALPFFAYEAVRVHGADLRALARVATRFALPAALVVGAVLWHNAARFGDPLEFGHRHLAVVWRTRIEKWGLFSTHYLGRNLAVLLASIPFFGSPAAPFVIGGHGLALWITSPFYAWALWPKRRSGLFVALAATAAVVALPSLLYQNSGWIQFGYRFSNDFAPLLFLMIAVGGRPFRSTFAALAAFAVVVNAFGAVTFQRSGFERFYSVDRAQTLFEPD